MKLQEFMEKFYPDYENRVKQLREYQKTLIGSALDTSILTEIKELFPEALQNFADKICEKQRGNCEQAQHSYMDCTERAVSILNAEQPKIEEL